MGQGRSSPSRCRAAPATSKTAGKTAGKIAGKDADPEQAAWVDAQGMSPTDVRLLQTLFTRRGITLNVTKDGQPRSSYPWFLEDHGLDDVQITCRRVKTGAEMTFFLSYHEEAQAAARTFGSFFNIRLRDATVWYEVEPALRRASADQAADGFSRRQNKDGEDGGKNNSEDANGGHCGGEEGKDQSEGEGKVAATGHDDEREEGSKQTRSGGEGNVEARRFTDLAAAGSAIKMEIVKWRELRDAQKLADKRNRGALLPSKKKEKTAANAPPRVPPTQPRLIVVIEEGQSHFERRQALFRALNASGAAVAPLLLNAGRRSGPTTGSASATTETAAVVPGGGATWGAWGGALATLMPWIALEDLVACSGVSACWHLHAQRYSLMLQLDSGDARLASVEDVARFTRFLLRLSGYSQALGSSETTAATTPTAALITAESSSGRRVAFEGARGGGMVPSAVGGRQWYKQNTSFQRSKFRSPSIAIDSAEGLGDAYQAWATRNRILNTSGGRVTTSMAKEVADPAGDPSRRIGVGPPPPNRSSTKVATAAEAAAAPATFNPCSSGGSSSSRGFTTVGVVRGECVGGGEAGLDRLVERSPVKLSQQCGSNCREWCRYPTKPKKQELEEKDDRRAPCPYAVREAICGNDRKLAIDCFRSYFSRELYWAYPLMVYHSKAAFGMNFAAVRTWVVTEGTNNAGHPTNRWRPSGALSWRWRRPPIDSAAGELGASACGGASGGVAVDTTSPSSPTLLLPVLEVLFLTINLSERRQGMARHLARTATAEARAEATERTEVAVRRQRRCKDKGGKVGSVGPLGGGAGGGGRGDDHRLCHPVLMYVEVGRFEPAAQGFWRQQGFAPIDEASPDERHAAPPPSQSELLGGGQFQRRGALETVPPSPTMAAGMTIDRSPVRDDAICQMNNGVSDNRYSALDRGNGAATEPGTTVKVGYLQREFMEQCCWRFSDTIQFVKYVLPDAAGMADYYEDDGGDEDYAGAARRAADTCDSDTTNHAGGLGEEWCRNLLHD